MYAVHIYMYNVHNYFENLLDFVKLQQYYKNITNADISSLWLTEKRYIVAPL